MNLESFRGYCLNKKGVTEEFPFGEDTFVYKVMGKVFAITSIDFPSVNLKCDPEDAIMLRERYTGVIPGYHMNKKHWNTVMMDGAIADRLVLEWVDASYGLVVATLSKSQKSTLDTL